MQRSGLSSLVPAKSANLDGININYASTKLIPEELTLVLIHGYGSSLETWHDVYPSLAARFQAVRLDLKGHGFSSKPDDKNYTLEDQARLVISFIKSLALKRVVLAGHSLGGGVALLVYFLSQLSNAPFTISKIILINSVGYPQQFPFFVRSISHPVTRFLVYRIPARIRAYILLNNIFVVKRKITADRIFRYSYFFDLPGSHNALEQTAKFIVPQNINELTSQFKDISVPTLIIWGANDNVVPIENAHRFERDIKRSKLVLIPETGHVPHEERPDHVLGELFDFIKSD